MEVKMKHIVTVNKAKQFYDILKRDIAKRKYAPGDKLPSIRDFSQTYEISRNTVNTVLAMLANEGIVAARDGVGTYVTDQVERTRNIGVMIFDFATSMRVDTDILNAIQRNIKQGFYLTLVDTSEDFTVFLHGLRRLVSMGVSGIIAVPPKKAHYTAEQADMINEVIGDTIPLVLMIRKVDGVACDYISTDLYKGILKALEYFSTAGKKRLCVVLHDSEKFIEEERRAVEEQANLLHLAWSEKKTLLPYTDNQLEMERRLSQTLPYVDALIAPDHILYRSRNLIRSTGRRIPQDLSIVGINDTIYSKLFTPALTSIAFPVEKIGKLAIETMISRIENGIPVRRLNRNLTPGFIIRNT